LAPSAFTEHSRVNIIQHPDGQPLKVVMTQNYVVYKTDSRVQYVADTMNGSSGSPVFNHKWEVVALHHSGRPYPPESLTEAAKKAWKGRFRVNEGIPMKAILQDFKDKGIDRYLPRE
jgi:V8-like Glu-specific endopeptidase